ncbi:MetQ/NlpA family ABC transporter substrate-binding protein [Microbacterium sp. APC 3898]|uniref:Lipoprotein n=1 Tax=Planococcus notacanthi TaxID=3035188 RepID=A0ABT7ZKC1_9BACL|nr:MULTISPECIES: MetQ/NlpA family ABC transporter substrate-binding protein [Terrabacteria group]MDN3427596.1 MetQ/NlpA family ABC transporter substrate-binding protein [Planococcus sp. APC 4016]MDN3436951.1 MetQ/NlpA family ABC transporter substrate-binding protein [Planococcus sp. APC 3900]MDN3499147.1 MetQ/NlpA family ABC transporter substrate-binding protein [Microbacterium sp. APC 3898]
MKKLGFILAASALALAACGSGEESGSEGTGGEASKDIKLGATAGPYSDMLSKAIVPGLEEKGYTVELVEFSDYIQPNVALDGGDIDANLFQHTIYLENFEKENGMDLSALITVPTAPMGLYSNQYDSLEAIEDGATIAIPNDPVNGARALLMLQDEGLVELDPEAEVLQASERDVITNEKNLEFQPIEAGQLPRAVDGSDLAAVPGNFAIAAEMDLLDALALENMPDQYRNVVAVNAENEDSELAKDLVEIVESAEFEAVIDEEFEGFGKPEWMAE